MVMKTNKRLLLSPCLIVLALLFTSAAPPQAEALVDSCDAAYSRQDYAAAYRYGLQALPLCEGTVLEADCLNLLAMTTFRQSDFERAIDYAKRCFAIDERSGDPDVMSSSLNTLAGIFIGANQPREAEKYILKAIDLARQADNPARMAVLQGMASEVYHALGDDQQALQHITIACDIEQKLGRADKLAMRQAQKASVLIGLHKYAEAEDILKSAIPTLREVGDYHSLGIADNKMGMAILQLGRNKEAIPYFKQAALIFTQMGDLANEMHAQRGLYECLYKSDPDSANVHLARFDLLKDSLYSNATAEMMARYDAEFRLDQLKQENEMHQQAHQSQQRRIRLIIGLCVLFVVAVVLVLWWTHRRMVKREQALKQYFAQRQLTTQSDTPDDSEDAPSGQSVEARTNGADNDFMSRLDGAVQKALSQGGLSVETVASEMYITRGQLNRRVKAITGVTTQQYILHLRLEQGRLLLESTELPIAEIGYQCGFEDAASFSRAFKRAFGQSPTQFRTKD